MNKIHIIIPVFNGWQQTKICLDALRASIHRNLEIIVVNHGSTDETTEALPSQYPEVVHILEEPTLWWTGATNLGIREAIQRGAESIMLLNNDCYVDSETIEKLIAHSRTAGEAIIAPVQRDFLTKRILSVKATTCFLLGFSTIIPRKTHKGIGKQMLLPTKLIIGGRGVLIPKSVLQRVGMFDEVNLPHYGSDNNFYLRCRNAGIPLFIAADSTVYIDSRTTTIASNLGNMSLPQFLESLRDRRSHRNIRDLSALFKLHYPIKGLYQLGVALNLFRYFALYGWKRLRHTLS